jgi:hypothetical protein
VRLWKEALAVFALAFSLAHPPHLTDVHLPPSFQSTLSNRLWTGDGILAQIGIATPNPIVTVILALGLFGGSAYGATQTLAKAQDGEMSYAQFKRYVKFFGADGDKVAESLSIDLKKMEAKGQFGFMDPDNMAAIAAARGENPADRVLSMEDTTAAAAAASKKKKVTSTMDPAAAFDIDYMGPPLGGVGAGAGGKPASVSSETAFALDIEINNGRWAMIGFALAVGIESASGNGIVGQLIGYAKMTGVLGPDSGF